MHFSKAAITAILAFTSVQGLPTQKRCDTCGGVSDKESKIEDSQKLPVKYMRIMPWGDFCEKCPPKEFFEAGGAGHGMTPNGMMGEFVAGLCNLHCGTDYPESYPNILQPRVTLSPSESNTTQPELVTPQSESTTTQPEITASQSAGQEYSEIKSDDYKDNNYTIQFEADDIIDFKAEQKGTCTTEGIFSCISGTSFQQCASGTWSVAQNMAPGTVCVAGNGYGLSTVAAEKRTTTTQDIQNSTSEEMMTMVEKKPVEKRLWIQIFKWQFFGPKPPVHLTPEEQKEKDTAAEIKYSKEFHQYGGHGDLKKEAEEKKAADEKHAKEFHQFGGVNKEDEKKKAEEKKVADEKYAKEFHQFGGIKTEAEKKKAKEEEKKALAWKQFGPKDGEKQE
ncbi:uncharacterized protein EAE98_003364 [Botrytis deweyae]|uniref:Uncharacterized protein n=1 Tax=Botrytis deweyae TaxID=2478750 RepID=A0ABQ7ITD5_9HELO|nr:uncharacterized protein EAE98_003364 [Botrytis deweyae]KAF7933655.1 hypothetical protein EAE98_003364 [Botrytis deweyae]